MAAAHVIGLGRSGIASARLLKKQGWSVTLSDAGQSESLQEKKKQLEAEGIKVLLNCRFSLNHLKAINAETPEQIIVSPGVPWDLPALLEARKAGIEMMGEMELAWRNLKQFPWIGITGTNGKTTTTALTAAIFKAAGLNAPACGNIGYSACELALKGENLDWVIAEISSYQIESASTLSPNIGIWTTFTPDHLERHGTIECYRAIKAALINQSTHKVINGDDPILNQGISWRWPQAWWTLTHPVEQHEPALKFAPKAFIQDDWVTIDGQRILDIKQLKMQGNHNLQNMLLAVSAAYIAGIEPEAIATGVANFPGVEHRLEHVGVVNGVELINDSKATNYDAAFTGLAAVKAPAILIAGGSPKKGDASPWIETIKEKAVSVLLIGDAAQQFSEQLDAHQYTNYEIVETMDRAVDRAIDLSRSLKPKSILLSPACASFDQYPNFEKRGEHFKSLCQNHL